MRLSKKIFYILAIAYFPGLLVLPLFLSQNSYLFYLLAFAIRTFPFYLVYLELGYQIILRYGQKPLRKGQTCLRIIGTLLSAAAVVAMLFSFIKLADLWLFYLIFAALLIPVWIARAVLSHTKPHIPIECRSRSFLITVCVMLALILLIGVLCWINASGARRYAVRFAEDYPFVYTEEHQSGYREGEKVVIQLQTKANSTYTLTANGKDIPVYSMDAEYTYFIFSMPARKVTIEIYVESSLESAPS